MGETLLVDDLHKRFGSGRRIVRANDGISMSVNAGQVVGILGHNGAGKTTMVNQIVGILRPDSGAIAVDGVDAVAHPNVARELVSVQAQGSVPITGLSPIQAIELVGRIRGGKRAEMRARAAELIEVLDLGEWARKPTDKVSGGVARLTAFAMSVVVPGKLVILDEPTNDVDPVRRRLLWDQIRVIADTGAAVLLVTHNIREAERVVDHLVILDHGRVLGAGTPGALVEEYGGGFQLDVDGPPNRDIAFPPEFRAVRHDSVHWSVSVPESRTVEAVAWAAGALADGAIERYELTPTSLEEVYVSLTSHHEEVAA